MDIAFAFDEGYAEHVSVAVESVLESHRHGVTLWLLTTEEVMGGHADAWRGQCAGRAGLRLLTAGDEFRSWGRSSREGLAYISAGTYLRLLLPALLPAQIDRVLYLDTDVLVCGDLAPLWELPLGSAALAATRDHFTETVGARGGIPGAPADIDPCAAYFNAGVLLINLPVWREMGVTEACLRYLSAQRGRLRLPDQDALNLACAGRWVELAEGWNDQVTWWHPYWDVPDTRILHFLGPYKPWQPDFQFHAARAEYERLLLLTRRGIAQGRGQHH